MNRRFSTVKRISLIIACLYSPGFYLFAAQPEYILNESPHPGSADDIKGPLDNAISEDLIDTPLFPELNRKLQELPAFLRDTRLALKPRVYEFHRNNSGFVDPDGSNANRALTSGGELKYQSGLLADRVSIGASYFTSQKMVGPANEGGTLLLRPIQTGFGVLGQSWVNVRITDGIDLRGYRQSFDLPYLNRRDNRMIPITHEGYTVKALNLNQNTDFISGYVHKMKERNSDRFIHMSEAAGAPGSDEGLFFAGARYRFNNELNIGAINYYSFDVMNTFYAETNANFEPPPNPARTKPSEPCCRTASTRSPSAPA